MRFSADEHRPKPRLLWQTLGIQKQTPAAQLNLAGGTETAKTALPSLPVGIEFTRFNYNTPQWKFHTTFYPCVKFN